MSSILIFQNKLCKFVFLAALDKRESHADTQTHRHTENRIQTAQTVRQSSNCLSFFVSFCLCVCVSVWLSDYVSVCLHAYVSFCLPVCLPVYLPVRLSACLSAYFRVVSGLKSLRDLGLSSIQDGKDGAFSEPCSPAPQPSLLLRTLHRHILTRRLGLAVMTRILP